MILLSWLSTELLSVWAWCWLDFHVMLYFIQTKIRVLFRVLCLGVSESLLSLCEKHRKQVLRLVLLVIVITEGCLVVQLVRSIVYFVKILLSCPICCVMVFSIEYPMKA